MAFIEELERLKKNGLYRHIKDRDSGPAGSIILINGIEYINFASNDYLGLSCHPSVAYAAKKAIAKYGAGAGASRLLSGGTNLHSQLENRIADFKGSEAALILNSGYTANTSVIPAIASEGDIIFSDELNHASIIDGCRLSKARTVIYRHKDIEHLSELIKKESGNKKIIITDSVFSMDGDIAPLDKIYELCRSLGGNNSILLYIDDAHGTGVLGGGRGALSHFGIKTDDRIIQMGTFSKAFGSFGAFIAASSDIIEWIINNARGFIFSTALPPAVIGANIAAVELVSNTPELVQKLWDNRKMLLKGFKKLGFDAIQSETPIIPLMVNTIKDAVRLSEHLSEYHIYAPAIRPPSVKKSRVRLAITAAHTKDDIKRLLESLNRFC
jgi:8-amino-7-oxononanoate synthase